MPLYEYLCSKCDHAFEELVRSRRQRVACPECRSRNIKKLISTFGVNVGASPSGGGHGGGCGCGRGG